MATTATNGAVKRTADEATEEVTDVATKKAKEEPKSLKEEALSNLQYRHLPYQEQLNKKQEEAEKIVKEFHSAFSKKYPKYSAWYKNVIVSKQFQLDTILTSPKTFAYRNKCELSIGFNPDLNKLCAGPRISDAPDGKVQVGPCDQDLIHLTTSMIEIAQDFSNFLDKWNYLEEACPWKNMFIRCTKNGDHMLIFIVREDTQEKLKEMKNEVVKYYTDDYNKKHVIKSIYLQPKEDDSKKKSYELEFLHAHGELHLIEDILDIKLVVTPGIYFRINSYAAELTFKKIFAAAELKKRRTVVIDLWCGSGALSLLAAKRAAHVVAIDPSKWNIKHAKFMAKYNKIHNIDFVIAKPEDGLKQIWHKLEFCEEVVIFADPPTLCKMTELGDIVTDLPNLSRFIYIHSSHKLHVIKNWLNLSQASLLPMRVTPVDVSPHSVRIEIIAVFRKADPYAQPLMKVGAGPPLVDPVRGAWIEEIEKRAFAMGVAKAMEVTAVVPPSRRPLLDDPVDDFGGYGARAPRGGAGAGGFRGRSRGFGDRDDYGDRTAGYGGYDDGYGGGYAEAGGYGRGGYDEEFGGGYGTGGYEGGYGSRTRGGGGGYGSGGRGGSKRGGGFGVVKGGFGSGKGDFGPSGFGPDADSYITGGKDGFGPRGAGGFGGNRFGGGSAGVWKSGGSSPMRARGRGGRQGRGF